MGLGIALRHFRHTHIGIVCGNLVSGITVVASTVVILVNTVIDYINADLIRILKLADLANLSAATFAGIGIHFAVVDFRTA